jgi:hypothetical protein
VANAVNPSAPPGKSAKYARAERERRFLLAAVPAASFESSTAISDRYLTGTRLRLRRWIETEGGSTTEIYKLTQKVPAADGGAGLLTTIYLSRDEYETLAGLPASPLRKVRHHLPPLVIDVFEPPLSGLVLAEAEFDSDEAMSSFAVPPLAIAEVSSDPRFTGGRLALTSRQELRRLLHGHGIELAA